jgi:hypothetical protein
MHCRQAFIDVPELSRAIGKVNLDKGKYWLDVDFPLGPPPEYEQIGYVLGLQLLQEITNDSIALSLRHLSSL